MKRTKTILRKVCRAINNKKGEEVVILDVSKVSSFTDYFIICHGHNQKQNQAICDSIQESLRKEEHLPTGHIEGYREAEWILMDYFDFIVHIFSSEARRFYKLEKLWSDGVQVKLRAQTA